LVRVSSNTPGNTGSGFISVWSPTLTCPSSSVE